MHDDVCCIYFDISALSCWNSTNAVLLFLLKVYVLDIESWPVERAILLQACIIHRDRVNP
jgi:hypothetical protein